MQDTEQWFTALYEQNASKMLRYASYQLRNASIAEELVEEAFVRLLQRREELWEHPNPAGWLWKTLQHLILTEVKLGALSPGGPAGARPQCGRAGDGGILLGRLAARRAQRLRAGDSDSLL